MTEQEDESGPPGESKETINESPPKKKTTFKPQRRPQRKPPSSFKGSADKIEDCTNVCSELKTKRWMTTRKKFTKCAGQKHSANEQRSLKNLKTTVITCEEPEDLTEGGKEVGRLAEKQHPQQCQICDRIKVDAGEPEHIVLRTVGTV